MWYLLVIKIKEPHMSVSIPPPNPLHNGLMNTFAVCVVPYCLMATFDFPFIRLVLLHSIQMTLVYNQTNLSDVALGPQ